MQSLRHVVGAAGAARPCNLRGGAASVRPGCTSRVPALPCVVKQGSATRVNAVAEEVSEYGLAMPTNRAEPYVVEGTVAERRQAAKVIFVDAPPHAPLEERMESKHWYVSAATTAAPR